MSRRLRAAREQGPLVSVELSTSLDDFYADLMGRRPELLDEKLKLHERIIDEFNLAALEKLSPEELTKQNSILCRQLRA